VRQVEGFGKCAVLCTTLASVSWAAFGPESRPTLRVLRLGTSTVAVNPSPPKRTSIGNKDERRCSDITKPVCGDHKNSDGRTE
jgi:hypothetical protein